MNKAKIKITGQVDGKHIQIIRSIEVPHFEEQKCDLIPGRIVTIDEQLNSWLDDNYMTISNCFMKDTCSWDHIKDINFIEQEKDPQHKSESKKLKVLNLIREMFKDEVVVATILNIYVKMHPVIKNFNYLKQLSIVLAAHEVACEMSIGLLKNLNNGKDNHNSEDQKNHLTSGQ